MNLMLISVSQRVHEIGLRRTVGARQRDILGQFLFEALGVALAGGLLGAAGGVAVASLLAWAGVAMSQITWIPFATSIVACRPRRAGVRSRSGAQGGAAGSGRGAPDKGSVGDFRD